MTEHRAYRNHAKPKIFWMPNAENARLMSYIRQRQDKGEKITMQTVCGEALDLYADKHGFEPFHFRSMKDLSSDAA